MFKILKMLRNVATATYVIGFVATFITIFSQAGEKGFFLKIAICLVVALIGMTSEDYIVDIMEEEEFE